MNQRWTMAAGIAALTAGAFVGGMLFSNSFLPSDGKDKIPEEAIQRLLNQPLPDLNGATVTLSQWQGKPLIVNFWATWCPPCLAEMPGFSRLQRKHPEVQFIGIAADTDGNVREFVAKMPPSYPILLGAGVATSLMASLGNNRNALPLTIALDATGHPRQLRLGAIEEASAERLIEQLLHP